MSSISSPKKTKNSEPILTQRKQTATAQIKKQTKSDISTPKQNKKEVKAEPVKALVATKQEKTKVVVKCNCGFSNSLYIRGEGAPGLSWEKGALMKCTKDDEWVWETDKPFKNAEFKIVLNDKQYETGENHSCTCGKSCSIKPAF